MLVLHAAVWCCWSRLPSLQLLRHLPPAAAQNYQLCIDAKTEASKIAVTFGGHTADLVHEILPSTSSGVHRANLRLIIIFIRAGNEGPRNFYNQASRIYAFYAILIL